MELGLDVSERDGYTVVVARGEIDVYTGPRLRQQFVELEVRGKYRVILDLKDVSFLDSTGLGILVNGLKRMRTHDGDLILVCTQRAVLKPLEITGLTKVFTIHDSLDAAIGA